MADQSSPQLKPQALPQKIAAAVVMRIAPAPDEKLLNYVGASADGLRADWGTALTDRQLVYFDPYNVWRVPLHGIAKPQYGCHVFGEFPGITFGDFKMPLAGPMSLLSRLLDNLAVLTGSEIALPCALPPDGVKFISEIPRGIEITIPFGFAPEWPDVCARCFKPDPTEIYVVTPKTRGTIASAQVDGIDLLMPFVTGTVDRLVRLAIHFEFPLPYCIDCLGADKGLRSRGPAVIIRDINSKNVTLFFARRKFLEMFIALNTGRDPAEILPPLPGRKK